MGKTDKGSSLTGIVLVTLGTLFLVDEFFAISVVGSLWPLALVGAGVYLLMGHRGHDKPTVRREP